MKLSSLVITIAAAAAGVAVLHAESSAPPGTDATSVVKALYAAFEAGDTKKIHSLIAPDATWTYHGPTYALPFAGVHTGPAGVDQFFVQVEQTLQDATPTQREFIVTGDEVAVPGTEESTVKATGGHYKVNNVHLFKVRNGKIVKFEEFIDSGEVLEAFQPAEPGRGKALFTTCAGCHGNSAAGRPKLFAPALTGQSPAYLIRQLRLFRGGTRGLVADRHGFQMQGRAGALPGDRGIRDVVSYIGTLPSIQPTAAKPGSSGFGAALYQPCAACHGVSGEGNAEIGAPRLTGLSRNYMVTQLQNFRTGLRGNDPNDTVAASMAAAAKQLPNNAAVASVAAIIARQ
jgi:cytochrome c553